MLTYADALNMNYYKKTSFTGWMEGMRFRLQRDSKKNEEGEETEVFFHAWVWPGPYIFDKVSEDQKTEATFPFDDDGRKAAVDWINDQLTSRADEWPRNKIDTTIM